MADVPSVDLPPVPRYICNFLDRTTVIDGDVSTAIWSSTEWSRPFGRIDNGLIHGPKTSIALRWDNEFLYAAFRIQDSDLRAHAVGKNEHVYLYDNDVELFVEIPGGYFEIGVSPANAAYQIHWTWLDPVIDAGDWRALEALLKLPDSLYYTRRATERLGRIGNRDYSMPGIRHAVQLDGSLNNPDVRDRGWSAEVAIPWSGLESLCPGHAFNHEKGSTLRIQGYCARHDWSETRTSEFSLGTPFEGFSWSAMGNTNVHNPERWAYVELR